MTEAEIRERFESLSHQHRPDIHNVVELAVAIATAVQSSKVDLNWSSTALARLEEDLRRCKPVQPAHVINAAECLRNLRHHVNLVQVAHESLRDAIVESPRVPRTA